MFNHEQHIERSNQVPLRFFNPKGRRGKGTKEVLREPLLPSIDPLPLRPFGLKKRDSISSQSDSTVDAADGDLRAAIANASAQLTSLYLADNGYRQVGIDAAIDAMEVNLGAGLGG